MAAEAEEGEEAGLVGQGPDGSALGPEQLNSEEEEEDDDMALARRMQNEEREQALRELYAAQGIGAAVSTRVSPVLLVDYVWTALHSR